MEFENYLQTSAHYDQTRIPLGVEILLGLFAANGRPLADQAILDAGCGTGNYLTALAPFVGRLTGLDQNPGMLNTARAKTAALPNVDLIEASLPRLPVEGAQYDAVISNFVIHHLDPGGPDENGAAYPNLLELIREAHRTLRPGGVLSFCTCSRRQQSDGYWWAALIPHARDKVLRRFPSLSALETAFTEAGFESIRLTVPLEAVLQGSRYLDPEGPLQESWRAGDSTWALCEPEELEAALARVRRMNQSGEMAAFLAEREGLRRTLGQATFVSGRKPASG